MLNANMQMFEEGAMRAEAQEAVLTPEDEHRTGLGFLIDQEGAYRERGKGTQTKSQIPHLQGRSLSSVPPTLTATLPDPSRSEPWENEASILT